MRVSGLVLIATLAASAAGAQAPTVAPSVQERTIGSWVLACAADPMTDRGECTLRHRLWIAPPADGAGGIALEIVLREDKALPAVTARRLSIADTKRAALALGASAELRVGAERMVEAPCGLEGRDAVCLPAGEAVDRIAAALPEANRILVRLRTAATVAGGGGEIYALDLEETRDAIAALREQAARHPPREAAPPARGLMEQLERLLRGG